MKITKYIHSCLVIEKGLDRILFDPGLFSFAENQVKPSQFQNLNAVVLTHYHPDHIDEESLKTIIIKQPERRRECWLMRKSSANSPKKTLRRKSLKRDGGRQEISFSKRLTRRAIIVNRRNR